MTDREWLVSSAMNAFTPKTYMPIDEWVDAFGLMLPSNTAEPGRYNIERAPYQRGPLQALSPNHPAKDIDLVFGAQLGKTQVQNTAMDYYMEAVPSPIGFVFSDEKNLKNYVENKFNPMISANEGLKNLLRSEGRSSGDTLSLKKFPGGFLKFMSGKTESSMRSDSLRIVIGDEVDTWDYTVGGDPQMLLRRRQNTFSATRKLCLASTPRNSSIITGYLRASTYRKYFVPCPCCGESITLEQDMLRWRLTEGTKDIVADAWMECPRCKGRISNEDKLLMLPKGEWVQTNPGADPTHEGFYLPTFYAPVGWVSFKDCAQEFVTADTNTDGHRDELLTAYYNTILAVPYVKGASDQKWRDLYERSLGSGFVRGRIPTWVNMLTTGADVQANRIEVSLYGWGRLGRSIAIDHWFIPVEDGEKELEIVNSDCWSNYTETVLNGVFEREDGLKMRTIANAIDSSYKATSLYSFFLSLPLDARNRLYLAKGRDNMDGYVASKKYVKENGLTDAYWYQFPVSVLKGALYDRLRETLKSPVSPEDGADLSYRMEYPNDYDQEYYQQLYAEQRVKDGKSRWRWEKVRDRNEVLDCTTYNLCLYYTLGCGGWTGDDWDALAERQRQMLGGNAQRVVRKPSVNRRMISKGIEL